jgi:hypothetical protein
VVAEGLPGSVMDVRGNGRGALRQPMGFRCQDRLQGGSRLMLFMEQLRTLDLDVT